LEKAAILERTTRQLRVLFHEGQFLDPVMRNIETFLQDTQHTVNGRSDCYIKPYFSLDGIESENDLMNTSFGQYGEMNNAWTSDDGIYQNSWKCSKHIFIGKYETYSVINSVF
jgi:argininosuccinate synthase